MLIVITALTVTSGPQRLTCYRLAGGQRSARRQFFWLFLVASEAAEGNVLPILGGQRSAQRQFFWVIFGGQRSARRQFLGLFLVAFTVGPPDTIRNK